MSSPFVNFPPNPTVPVLPGVPPLNNPLAVILPVLAFADSSAISPLAPSQWGIYSTSGTPVITATSVQAVEYARDYRISDYPQEQGAFESYNKVQLPYQAKVTFVITGTDADRSQFLSNIEAAVASLNFVSVVTPEFTYPSANLTHYSYRRESRRGIKMITVEVWCEEVRVTATQQYTNTQSINGASTNQNGTTQPTNTVPNGNGFNAGAGLPNVPASTALT